MPQNVIALLWSKFTIPQSSGMFRFALLIEVFRYVTGTLTVTRKAHIAGLIAGAMSANGSLGSGHKADHQLLQRQLADDLDAAGPSLDEPAFSNRQVALSIDTIYRAHSQRQDFCVSVCSSSLVNSMCMQACLKLVHSESAGGSNGRTPSFNSLSRDSFRLRELSAGASGLQLH